MLLNRAHKGEHRSRGSESAAQEQVLYETTALAAARVSIPLGYFDAKGRRAGLRFRSGEVSGRPCACYFGARRPAAQHRPRKCSVSTTPSSRHGGGRRGSIRAGTVCRGEFSLQRGAAPRRSRGGPLPPSSSGRAADKCRRAAAEARNAFDQPHRPSTGVQRRVVERAAMATRASRRERIRPVPPLRLPVRRVAGRGPPPPPASPAPPPARGAKEPRRPQHAGRGSAGAIGRPPVRSIGRRRRPARAASSKFWGVTWHKSNDGGGGIHRCERQEAQRSATTTCQEAAAHAVNAAIRRFPPDVQRRRHTNSATRTGRCRRAEARIKRRRGVRRASAGSAPKARVTDLDRTAAYLIGPHTKQFAALL